MPNDVWVLNCVFTQQKYFDLILLNKNIILCQYISQNECFFAFKFVNNNCKNFSVVKSNTIHKINLQGESDVLQGRKRFCTTSALANLFKRGVSIMAKNTVPEAKEALNRFKMEAASEVGVFLH